MLNLYPLNAVITSDTALSDLYDNHPASVNLISACLTPQELDGLLNQGAIFQSVVFVNNEGQQLLGRLTPIHEQDDDVRFPVVHAISLDRIGNESIPIIHSTLGKRRARGFFAMGG
ncbi:MAG: hypothetical protein JWR22_4318 [Herminiimonas sp.]|nr:hypothetical protein [Herminiimonas sp.]